MSRLAIVRQRKSDNNKPCTGIKVEIDQKVKLGKFCNKTLRGTKNSKNIWRMLKQPGLKSSPYIYSYMSYVAPSLEGFFLGSSIASKLLKPKIGGS